jgi:hypothetical protein
MPITEAKADISAMGTKPRESPLDWCFLKKNEVGVHPSVVEGKS